MEYDKIIKYNLKEQCSSSWFEMARNIYFSSTHIIDKSHACLIHNDPHNGNIFYVICFSELRRKTAKKLSINIKRR